MTNRAAVVGRIVLAALALAACTDLPTAPRTASPEAERATIPDPRFRTFRWGLNQYETALIATQPWLKDCTRTASAKAIQYTDTYAQKRGRTVDDGYRANAFQHAIWNVLLAKECGWAFSTVAGAEGWAKRFTDAHERGTPNESPFAEMDFHNNARGREVFRQYAYTYWAGPARRVGWQDDVFLQALMSSKADKAAKFAWPSELSRHSSKLVFVRGN